MRNVEQGERKIFVGAEHRKLMQTAKRLSKQGWEVYRGVGSVTYTVDNVSVAGGLLGVCVLTVVKNFAKLGAQVTVNTSVGIWEREDQVVPYERVVSFFEYTREAHEISGMDARWLENVNVI